MASSSPAGARDDRRRSGRSGVVRRVSHAGDARVRRHRQPRHQPAVPARAPRKLSAHGDDPHPVRGGPDRGRAQRVRHPGGTGWSAGRSIDDGVRAHRRCYVLPVRRDRVRGPAAALRRFAQQQLGRSHLPGPAVRRSSHVRPGGDHGTRRMGRCRVPDRPPDARTPAGRDRAGRGPGVPACRHPAGRPRGRRGRPVDPRDLVDPGRHRLDSEFIGVVLLRRSLRPGTRASAEA